MNTTRAKILSLMCKAKLIAKEYNAGYKDKINRLNEMANTLGILNISLQYYMDKSNMIERIDIAYNKIVIIEKIF